MGSLAVAAAAMSDDAAGSVSFNDETSSTGSCCPSVRTTDESDDRLVEGVAIESGTGS